MRESHSPDPVALSRDTVLAPYPSPRLEQTEVGGETVVFDTASTAVHVLDRTGTLVWQLLDGRRTIREVGESIAAAFERPVEEILDQVTTFACQLERMSLVERRS